MRLAALHLFAFVGMAFSIEPATDYEGIISRESAWRAALGRAPTAEENAEAIALLKSLNAAQPHAAFAQFCLALFNLQEFAYAD